MSTFEKLRTHHIPSLQATLEEYVDPSTGARHVHLANEQSEMAFLVAFPTVPDNSDGRAHILEHLALSGSDRYPVRDPFFAMLRRSTATFMNAMTYADRTVYPFASTDRNDFFNLLDIYLDATFFPKLDYLNFLQEGWRHEIEGDRLSYQGVVFNEMKGAFADPTRALYNGLGAALLTGTTYEVVSGGDPLAIPDLSHEALKQFHATHYHPSQAVFMTAGPVPAEEVQRQIAERVFSRTGGRLPPCIPQLAQVDAPREASIRVPSATACTDGFGVQVAWILGESSDPDVFYQANLLHAGLLGDAAAPLNRAMESAGFGRPSRMNGMDSSARQLVFHAGMEGLSQEQVDPARCRIWNALEETARTGVPQAVLQAALRDIKYSQRDTSSSRMPNMLMRLLRAVPVAMRGGDVFSAFDSAPVLVKLEREIADPAFFKRLVQGLLDSPARLDARVVPDPDYFNARAAAEEKRLAETLAGLSAQDRERITAESDALEAQQRLPGDTSVLPRIKPGDVSPEPRKLPAIADPAAPRQVFQIASNEISYARVQYDVSAIPEREWPWVHLYMELTGDLGVAGRSYEEAGAWRQQMVTTFAVFTEPVLAGGRLDVALNFEASALAEEQEHIAKVLETYIRNPRFDEHERIAFLTRRLVQQHLKDLAQAGDHYASLAAAAPLSPLRRYEDMTDGVGVLPFLGELDRLGRTPEGIARIAARLQAVHALVTASPVKLLCAGSGEDASALAEAFSLALGGMDGKPALAGEAAASPAGANYALYAPSQVNHCHIAWSAPTEFHADAPALAVAAQLMTNQYLHQAVREQGGAYGGSAAYAYNAGVFGMRSYRDPRLADTYADFAAAIDHVLDKDFSVEQVEEAIIGVIKGLDRPDSPFDAVVRAWNLNRRGVDEGVRARFRTGVLNCKLAEVKTAVRKWLKEGAASRAAFVGNTSQDLAGLEVLDLRERTGISEAL